MRWTFHHVTAAVLLFAVCVPTVADDRPRLLVLTDIGGDPDDQQSMIRLLVHANEFQIEGLIASASGTPGELKQAVTKPQLIREIVEAYGKVLANLRKHAEGFPDTEALLGMVKSGNARRGVEAVGEGHDTDGSGWIIACADRDDPRPLNVAIWGGQTDLAQALWRVRQDRGDEGLERFVSRLRVFDIADQDRLYHPLSAQYPDLFYVLSKSPDGADRRLAAFRGMYLGGDESLTSRKWVDAHVRLGHGPLGALYPTRTWTEPNPHGTLKEGDTPSWFYFLNVGLGDPAHPQWGGWGGRYAPAQGKHYRDGKETVGEATDTRAGVWRWRPAFQNEFAARMDWCVTDDFKKANHPPRAALNGDATRNALHLTTKRGQAVTLDATASTDPDGQTVRFNWFIDRAAEAMATAATVSADSGPTVQLVVPRDHPPGAVHVILIVADDGAPPLTRYRRAVITVQP